MLTIIHGVGMIRIDHLIHRLRYPLTVAIEDALDDIKKYWDEAANTVSGYWNDTDDEIADEIGISKPSLAQLLDDNRNGLAYSNLGGNSGVDSYDVGEDWILVKFSTGSKYLYTTKSTSLANIEQMKRYAHEGKGLNSFIMRTLKTDYAGRNVKGELVIKPGMERWVIESNKRLQLLYAYKQTLTISTEGYTMAHNTLRKYKDQLNTAGIDGLDPVAVKLMTVGLEQMGYRTNISNEDCNDQSRSVALVEIVDRKLRVATEGIFESLKKLFGGSKKAETPGNLEIAAIDTVAKFTNGNTVSIPSIHMSGPKTSIFLKNGKYNHNWMVDLQKDLLEYNKLLKAASTYDSKLDRWEYQWRTELEKFNGDADRADEFIALLKKVQADEPAPWYDVFKPTHEFVMWGKGDWTDGEEGFSHKAIRPDSASIEISEIPANKIPTFKKMLTDLANLIDLTADTHYEMFSHGPDFTDPPYRGYSTNEKVVEVMNKFKVHAQVSNDPWDQVYLITVRLELIMEDLANYIELANKHAS